jgi:hypothetical protein
MAIPVEIVWSLENGGPNLDEPLDHGSNATQDTLDPKLVFIRHTGDNDITAAGIYMREFTGSTGDGETYSGDAALPTGDFNEIVGWGDETDVSFFGGFQVNMDAAADFPLYNWPDESNKVSVSGVGFVVSSGVADSETNAFDLKKEMSGTTSGVFDGIIPAGAAPNYRMQMRIQVPASGVDAGVRMFEHVLKFTYTS